MSQAIRIETYSYGEVKSIKVGGIELLFVKSFQVSATDPRRPIEVTFTIVAADGVEIVHLPPPNPTNEVTA